MSRAKTNYERYLAFKVNVGYKLNTKHSVWVPDESEGFVKGEVQSDAGGKLKVKMGDGEERTVIKKDTEDANPSKFDGVDDCAELSYLNNATVLHNLRVRYDEDLIHTYSGLFLVVINPYKWIPIYTPEIISLYQGKRRNEVHPHTFAVADQAYRDMMRNGKNQSILITGESGAGKTENTKKVIQYLATIAGKASQGGKLEEQILEANPMLEAFGNAKTNKNDNSSRFGKFIRIQFNAGGIICGTTIEVYILEKSRVVHQGKGERSFHIFYQIIDGTNGTQKKTYHVGKANSYGFFSDKSSNNCKTLNDKDEWEHTNKSMKIIGLSEEERDCVFRIIAGIMQCGNLKYKSSYSETASITTPDVLDNISELWRIDRQKFEKSIIKPRVKAGTEVVEKHLNIAEAEYSVQAMCKSVYERLFLWLVKKLNSVLESPTEKSFIGVLDIAGFEIFEMNSFEQLCINFTNEKLQQFFNLHMFKLEQEEYAKEQIKWTYIDFGVDSRETISTIEEKNNSLLSLLDEETIFPRASDESLIAKLHTLEKKHKKYQKVKFKKFSFSLGHYAGDVEYDVTGWITKNKDPLQDDIAATMTASGYGFIGSLFTDPDLDVRARIAAAKKKAIEAKGRKVHSTGSGASFMTVAQAYKDQLTDLMATLGATAPHFIRCIIPNLEKRPGRIACDLLLEQLRCNGVLEGIKISRKGYPNRIKYAEFVRRYYLLHDTLKRTDPEKEEGTKKIMKANTKTLESIFADESHKDIEKPYWQYGITKIFFRHGVLAKLEELREGKLASMVINIQAAARGWLGRRAYRNIGQQSVAAKTLQRNIKTWLRFREWPWWQCFVASKPFLQKVGIESVIQDLEEKIARLEKEIAEGKGDIEKLKKELASKQSDLEELREDLDAAEGKVDRLEKEKKDLTDENDNLNNRLEDLENNVQTVTAAKKTLQQKLDGGGDDLEETLEDVKSKKKAVTTLKSTIQDQEDEIDELDSTQADLTGANSRIKGQVSSLEDELDDAHKNLEASDSKGGDLKRKFETLKADQQDAEDENTDVKKDIASLKGGNATTNDELEDAKDQLDSTKSAIAAANSTIKGLKTDIEDKQGELNKAERKGNDLSKANKGLTVDIEDLEHNKEDSERSATSTEKKNKELTEKLAELEDDASRLEGEVSTLTSTKKSNATNQADLEAELANLNKALDKARAAQKKTEGDLGDTEGDVDAAKDEVSSLEKAVKGLESDLKNLKEDIEDAQSANSGLEKSVASLEKKNKQLASDLTDANDSSSSASDNNSKLKTKLSEAEEEVEAAEKEAAELARSVKSLSGEVEDVKAEAEEAQADKERAEKALKSANTQISDGESDLADLQSEKKDLDSKMKKKKAELEDLQGNQAKESLAQAKAEYRKGDKILQEELEQVQGKARKVESENRALQRKIKKAEEELAELKESNKDLEKAAATIDAQASESEKEMKQVKKDNEKLKEKTSDEEAELKKVLKELEKYRSVAGKAIKLVGADTLTKRDDGQVSRSRR